MNATGPISHDVVLVGGGHSHALLLRRWAMNPMAGVRLTLVSRDVLTPYSGMLPGFVAGHYSFDEIHIDLVRLCAWAGVRFIKAEMTGIDLSSKTLQLSGRPDVSYDILSAGAGGFELVMAMAHRMKAQPVTLHWFLRGEQPMSDRPDNVGAQALQAANEAGVQVHTLFDVERVEEGKLIAADGRTQSFDDLLWCTAASAPAWPKAAGLDTDDRGFVATNAKLQSVSHPDVFATGDIGTQIETPSAKAGVFAVRQAPKLFHNIRALLGEGVLRDYVPQKDFLSLVSTGGTYAIGSRSGFTFHGHWVWRWKDRIDRAFMNKFQQLPAMQAELKKHSDPTVEDRRCNGCGAKVPAELLDEVIADLPKAIVDDVDVASGVEDGGDAAIVSWSSNQLVQSVDHLRALIDDPYEFGRIAALHALSDVYTVGARAHSAQVLLTIPYAKPKIVKRELTQLMLGIQSALIEERCVLLGGHTAEGAELQVGLVVNASPPVTVDTNTEHEPMSMVLTQALGIGVLFAGLMQGQSQGVDVDAARQAMLQSNAHAVSICQSHGMRHCTDVTGFGRAA